MRKLKHWIAGGSAAAILIAGAASAPPATAAASDCPQGWVCLFDGIEWSGRMLQFQDWGVWQNLGAYGFNDQATSWVNHTNRDARIAIHNDGGGGLRCLRPGQGEALLPAGWNNEASSIRVFSTATVC